MRVFVTGGTGFVGTHAVKHLRAAGHEVRALVRKTSDTSALGALGVETFEGTMADADRLEEGIRGCDAVLHIAGLIKARSEAEMIDVNGAGTGRLAEAALRANPQLQRFVYTSSIAAAGPGAPDFAPISERDEPHPVSVYGRSKLIGEQRLQALSGDLPVTIIRPPVVYGPRDREVLRFFQMVKRRVLPVPGSGRSRLSVVYIDDLCRAFEQALTRPHDSGSLFFVEDGHAWTWPELGREIGAALGVKPRAVRLPVWVFEAASRASATYGRVARKAVMLTPDKVAEMRQDNWLVSSDAIRDALGWAPTTDFHQGAKVTADWYRQAGWL